MATQNPTELAASGSARERLLDTAEALIYAGGIHATGVDAIVKQSGTARKSFYTHFESKDALVAAALERRDERWMNWFIAGTLQHGKTARDTPARHVRCAARMVCVGGFSWLCVSERGRRNRFRG